MDVLRNELFMHSFYFLSILNYILVFGIENVKVIDYDDIIADGRAERGMIYVYIYNTYI
jgi:hypothetical protein